MSRRGNNLRRTRPSADCLGLLPSSQSLTFHIAPSVRHKRRKTRPRKKTSSRTGPDAKAREKTMTVCLPSNLYRCAREYGSGLATETLPEIVSVVWTN
jgi:hypothetical protein